MFNQRRFLDAPTLVAIAVTLFFWSSAFSGIRVGLQSYNAGHVTLLRFLVASLAFAVYALATRMPLPRLRDWPRLAAVSFLGISVYHTALNYGETAVDAGTASMIIAAAPIFTALIAWAALGERLTAVGWLGVLVSFFGVGIIALGAGHGVAFTHGALLVLLSAVTTSLYFVYQKPLFQSYPPIHVTAYVTWFGTVPLLVFAPGLGAAFQHASPAATAAVVYIGLFPAAVAYAAWTIALSRAPAGVVTSFLYLNPVLALIVSHVWLGESPQPVALLGGAVALFGVVLVNLWGKEKVRPAHAA